MYADINQHTTLCALKGVLLRLKHSVVGDVGGDGFVFCGLEEVGRWAEWVLVVLDGCPAYKLHA